MGNRKYGNEEMDSMHIHTVRSCMRQIISPIKLSLERQDPYKTEEVAVLIALQLNQKCDFIDLTVDDEQSQTGDLFGFPDTRLTTQEKATNSDSFLNSDFEYLLVKSKPVDLSVDDISDVVIVSEDNIADLRYVCFISELILLRIHAHVVVFMLFSCTMIVQ